MKRLLLVATLLASLSPWAVHTAYADSARITLGPGVTLHLGTGTAAAGATTTVAITTTTIGNNHNGSGMPDPYVKISRRGALLNN
ncbi:hypothetical protein [Candidatus Erwinia dacicola]|uniref:Uncharacterized protein n=1 Tax=Candidatus Erwinia dacicola TaxID=252393 RepID=A0A1E7YUF6_9GAMM|nr:hypothetical protein BBW68_03500 [Candidatus Erwinia dacicola]